MMRGLNLIFMDIYDAKVLGKIRPEDDAPRKAMCLALDYLRRLNLARATPHNALSSTAYCLAEPGVAYLVFAPEGGRVKPDLLPGNGMFAVAWRNPATGEAIKAKSIAGGADQTHQVPFEGPAVLFPENKTPIAPRGSLKRIS